jgi:hypothetical protein
MATPRKNDHPNVKVSVSLSSLESEAEYGEAFTVALSNNKVISFPNPGEMPFDEAEEFMQGAEGGQRSTDVLKRWLSEEDYALLMAEKPSLLVMMALMDKVSSHYEAIFGSGPKG